MKLIYPLLEEVGENLVKFIDNHPEMSNGEGYEAKELCGRFTLDNVATTAFGIDGKCLVEENSEFRQFTKEFFTPSKGTILILFLMTAFPPLSKFFKIKLIPKQVEERLTDMIMQTVNYREKNNIVRNDFLNILMELRKSSDGYKFEDIDLVAHAAGFLGDGFETSSIVLSFALFELARNPETQKKLREEIKKALGRNKNKLPYDVLQELQYLDAVINGKMLFKSSKFFGLIN